MSGSTEESRSGERLLSYVPGRRGGRCSMNGTSSNPLAISKWLNSTGFRAHPPTNCFGSQGEVGVAVATSALRRAFSAPRQARQSQDMRWSSFLSISSITVGGWIVQYAPSHNWWGIFIRESAGVNPALSLCTKFCLRKVFGNELGHFKHVHSVFPTEDSF